MKKAHDDDDHDHDHYDDFIDSFTHQFDNSNSLSNNVITTHRNSSYPSLLAPSFYLRPAITAPFRPSIILTPFHESQIQAAVRCSKKLGMHIRIRSGGHDFEALSYTSQLPFILIDLMNFKSISISTDLKTAWVQAGATLGQLYHTLANKSRTLSFPAGVCPSVGVGGHFSGGGYGMMARKHSIAADHIIDAKLVNAAGEILDRRGMGEDLFWAIRGGGGTSFGIVLEFQVTLVTVPETVTAFRISRTSEAATQLVHRWQYVTDELDDDILLRLFLHSVTSPVTGNRTIAASFAALYLGRARELVQHLEEKFPELGLVEDECKEMSWIESELFFAGLQGQPVGVLLDRNPHGNNPALYFKGKSDYVTSPIPVDGLRGMWRFLHEEGELRAELQFSPYGGAISKFSEWETPFPHRKGNIFMIEYAVGWVDSGETEKHSEWMRRLHDYMECYVTKSPRAAYVNYRDLDLGINNMEEGNITSYEQASSWGLRYFKNNFERLVRIKTRVDPTNFFRNEQSIPPLYSS